MSTKEASLEAQQQIEGKLPTPQLTEGENPTGLALKAHSKNKRRFLPRAVGLVLGGLAAYFYPIIENNVTYAQNILFPDTHPRSGLDQKKGVETIINSEYSVEDMRVVNGNPLGLITLPDGQHIVEGIVDPTTGKLTLKDKKLVPFLATAVFGSEDGLIKGAAGRTAPGTDQGEVLLTKDGGSTWEAFHQDAGEVLNAEITPDKQYLLTREHDPSWATPPALYSRNLTTNIRQKLTSCVGCIQGIIQAPVSTLSSTLFKYRGPARPAAGYAETIVDTAKQTVTTNIINPEEGFCGTKTKLMQFVKAGKQIIGMINNDTYSPIENRALGTLFWNEDDVHILAKDVRPTVSFYKEITKLADTVIISSVVPDVSSDTGYMVTGVNVNNVYFIHVESFSLSDPANVNLHLLLPQDGAWPTSGKHGTGNSFVDILFQGSEKYLLLDVKSDKAGESGLLMRRITNGINANDVWIKVAEESNIYKLYIPTVSKN